MSFSVMTSAHLLCIHIHSYASLSLSLPSHNVIYQLCVRYLRVVTQLILLIWHTLSMPVSHFDTLSKSFIIEITRHSFCLLQKKGNKHIYIRRRWSFPQSVIHSFTIQIYFSLFHSLSIFIIASPFLSSFSIYSFNPFILLFHTLSLTFKFSYHF